MTRPLDCGNVFIERLNTSVSFNVTRPAPKLTLLDDPAPPKVTASDRSPSGSVEDGKTHVVWNVDVAKVQALFEEQVSVNSTSSGISLGTAGNLDITEENRSADSSPMSRSPSHAPLDVQNTIKAPDASQRHAYTDGERVEYFSHTHQQWIVGMVRIQPSADCCPGAAAKPLLSVYVNHGSQFQPNVSLDCLRPVLQSGELVEVFTQRGGGSFLPAVIAPGQPKAATMLGYKVALASTGEVLENIPALRLRRRYPAASAVETYCGLDLGWCHAHVDPNAASSDGCGGIKVLSSQLRDSKVLALLDSEEASPKAPETPQAVCAMPLSDLHIHEISRKQHEQAVRAEASQLVPPEHNFERGVKSLTSVDIPLWTWVPLCRGDGPPEWVSSHLVHTSGLNASGAI